ncbi:EEP domain-containing protein [Candidatus Palibaumannia cicadellinicola]|uniref:EEP domain-containing protein n=1 Tax=Candidatus Palibaumannia cicadellinicola TaxID=186490 RepID=A0A2N4XWW7_9GAMM|nr:endonuclease/exonuclease/phosphatase family protein [Candidatus Baumannia cicadellinicola]PLK58404.1 EEP domain-containing protein [Candidatus Baumannia cicadellinicola]
MPKYVNYNLYHTKQTYAVRYIAGQPVKRIFPPLNLGELKYTQQLRNSLLNTHILHVMVWNIFKQQRANWLSVLQNFGKNNQLVLLQEAQTTPELISFATSHYLATDQVPALIFLHNSSGVMTLSAAHPVYCCPLREKEPLLRIAKSALITIYPVYQQQLLMVINIHAVNFSLGLDVYSKQLGPIGDHIINHTGPVISAGDFNAWSRQRILALYKFTKRMMLGEVSFINDQRKKFFGRPLDFIFYRDMAVTEASVLVTQASDHNPLLVTFNLYPK